MNVQGAAIHILKDAGKPLHAKEISEMIVGAGFWKNDDYYFDMGESSIEK